MTIHEKEFWLKCEDEQDTSVHVAVCPYVYMRKNEGMAVQVSLRAGAPNVESHFIQWDTNFDDSCHDDIVDHVKEFIEKGGIQILKDAVESWKLEREKFAEKQKLREQAEVNEKAEMKKKGYNFFNTVYVHNQGDDDMVQYYSVRRPTEKELHDIVRKYGGVVFNDFKIEQL